MLTTMVAKVNIAFLLITFSLVLSSIYYPLSLSSLLKAFIIDLSLNLSLCFCLIRVRTYVCVLVVDVADCAEGCAQGKGFG